MLTLASKHVNSLHILTYRTTCINLLLWQHYWHHISDRLTGSPSSPLTTFTQVTTRLPDLDLPLLTPIQLPLVFVNEPRPPHTSDTRWRHKALTSKPTMVYCVVVGCNNGTNKDNPFTGSFHRFPQSREIDVSGWRGSSVPTTDGSHAPSDLL